MKKCTLEILHIIQNANMGKPVGIQTINNRLSDDCFEELIVNGGRFDNALKKLVDEGTIVVCGDKGGYCLSEKGKQYLSESNKQELKK